MSTRNRVKSQNPYARILEKDAFLNQMDSNARGRRFGLFGHAGSNALGDDSKCYIPKVHKGPNGKVPKGPKNFLVGDRRKKYFKKTGYNTIGDEYLELDKIERFGKMLKNLSIPHEKVFKSTTSKKLKNMWPYMEDPIRVVPCNKGPDGKVQIQKKNFIQHTGWHTHKYQHMVDPYDRAERLRREEKLKHKAKILHPFRSTTNYGTTFQSNWQVYRQLNKKKKRGAKVPTTIHDKPFKPTNPSKLGHEKTFQTANYIPEMQAEDLKTKYIFEKKTVQPWRPTHKVKQAAQPSVMNRWIDQMGVRTSTKY